MSALLSLNAVEGLGLGFEEGFDGRENESFIGFVWPFASPEKTLLTKKFPPFLPGSSFILNVVGAGQLGNYGPSFGPTQPILFYFIYLQIFTLCFFFLKTSQNSCCFEIFYFLLFLY